MESTKLISALRTYGADMAGIAGRFLEDAEFYEDCFRKFLENNECDQLGQALSRQDYRAAFEAAHSLKGVTGNLGLTPLFQAVCVLVEALRAGQYEQVAAQYAAVTRAFETLRALA